MSIPVPGDASRGLVSFRLFGIPVSIHTSFLVIAFLLGLGPLREVRQQVADALVWVAVVTVSVIVHELGHALVARPAGGEPRIDLFAMAGLTRWNPSRAGRGRRVAVSLSGVGAGVAVGLALLLVYGAVDPPVGSMTRYAFEAALFANLGWGLVNLVPMLPLDGGQVVRALMPGRDELAKDKRTAVVSLVTAAALVAAAVAANQVILAFFVLFFGLGNMQTLLASRRLAGGRTSQNVVERANLALNENRPEEALALLRPFDHPAGRVLSAAALLRLDRAREAQDLLLDLPGGVTLDPVFEATVLMANGQDRLSRERLAGALGEDTSPWATRELADLLYRRGEDLDAVLGDVRGLGASGVANALFARGAFAEAAAWTERALGSGAENPYVAFNAACSWARAGDLDKALRAMDLAALFGFDDARLADEDPDLAPLREHPGWAAVRQRIG